MNVKQLRKKLKGLPDDMPILLSSDPEGNDFSDLEAYGFEFFHRVQGEVELLDDEDSNEYDGTRALVLWP